MTKVYQVVYQVVYGFGLDPGTGRIQDPLGDYFVRVKSLLQPSCGENETLIKEAFKKVFTDAGMEVPEVTIEEVIALDLSDFIHDVKAAM